MTDAFQIIPPDLAFICLVGLCVFCYLFHPELF